MAAQLRSMRIQNFEGDKNERVERFKREHPEYVVDRVTFICGELDIYYYSATELEAERNKPIGGTCVGRGLGLDSGHEYHVSPRKDNLSQGNQGIRL